MHKNWYRVHIDFFQFADKHFLLIVDSKLKWLDVLIMNSTNLDSTIDKLHITFSTMGFPVELVSDNGPPFDSHGFRQFCKKKDINYINTPPYNPQFNGLAERSVRIIEEYLKRDYTDKKKHLSFQNRITNFLDKYTLLIQQVNAQQN